LESWTTVPGMNIQSNEIWEDSHKPYRNGIDLILTKEITRCNMDENMSVSAT
jgi:hypothetical protein